MNIMTYIYKCTKYKYIMVNQDNLKQLKKKLSTFKKISQKDSKKGRELAEELIILIDNLLLELTIDRTKLIKELNLTRGALKLYLTNLKNMDDLKTEWK